MQLFTLELNIPHQSIDFYYCTPCPEFNSDYPLLSLDEVVMNIGANETNTCIAECLIQDIYNKETFMKIIAEQVFSMPSGSNLRFSYFITPDFQNRTTEIHGVLQNITFNTTYLFSNNIELVKLLVVSNKGIVKFKGKDCTLEKFLGDYISMLQQNQKPSIKAETVGIKIPNGLEYVPTEKKVGIQFPNQKQK